MEKVKEVINKVEAKLSHNNDTTTTGTHATGTHGHTTGHTTGHGNGVAGTHGTAGPHDSNLANKTDPRVDSDLDGSRNAGIARHGTGAQYNTGTTGQNTAGPHSSNLANKADPRVDSDLDGSRNAGAAKYGPGATSGAGLTGSHQTTGAGYGNTNTGSSNNGPHNSNLANKIDPRVDSDLDGSRNAGIAQYGPGATNTHSGAGYGNTGSGLTGSTGAGYGNEGLTGTSHTSTHTGGNLTGQQHGGLTGQQHSGLAGQQHGGLAGQQHGGLAGQQHGGLGHQNGGLAGHNLDGPAPNTAGTHKSDVLNKIDPRIDSDRDGSKTIGGNQQY